MEWIKIILLSLALAVCLLGVKQDKTERKFSNIYISIILIMGIIIATVENRLSSSLITFLLINVVGIFMSALHIFGASDWKLFGAIGLYIPIFSQVEYGVVFGICFIIYGIYQKVKSVNKGRMKEALLDEWEVLKYFVMTRKRLVIEQDSRGVYKEATIAATEGIVFAFFITSLMLI